MNKLLIGTIAFCTLATVAGFFALERRTPVDDLNGQAAATTGLLRESLTVDELLEEIDADAGDEFTPADRERLAAELREALGD